jgi:MarR family transcriptional regulator, transcriptional regulator for hemolysin
VFREDLTRNFGFILHDVARLLRTTFDRKVKALGLTRSQWWVLNHLFRNDGITQSELVGHADDRRAKRIFLTDEVEPAMQTMRAAAAELRRDALAGFSAAEKEQFVDTLLRLKANLAGAENGASKQVRNNRRTRLAESAR